MKTTLLQGWSVLALLASSTFPAAVQSQRDRSRYSGSIQPRDGSIPDPSLGPQNASSPPRVQVPAGASSFMYDDVEYTLIEPDCDHVECSMLDSPGGSGGGGRAKERAIPNLGDRPNVHRLPIKRRLPPEEASGQIVKRAHDEGTSDSLQAAREREREERTREKAKAWEEIAVPKYRLVEKWLQKQQRREREGEEENQYSFYRAVGNANQDSNIARATTRLFALLRRDPVFEMVISDVRQVITRKLDLHIHYILSPRIVYENLQDVERLSGRDSQTRWQRLQYFKSDSMALERIRAWLFDERNLFDADQRLAELIERLLEDALEASALLPNYGEEGFLAEDRGENTPDFLAWLSPGFLPSEHWYDRHAGRWSRHYDWSIMTRFEAADVASLLQINEEAFRARSQFIIRTPFSLTNSAPLRNRDTRENEFHIAYHWARQGLHKALERGNTPFKPADRADYVVRQPPLRPSPTSHV